MDNEERLQRMIERIQEDERLRGDLEDTAATALVEWAIKRTTEAFEHADSDQAFQAAAQTIRSAARAAARSGALEATEVVARADQELTSKMGVSAASTEQSPPAAAYLEAPPAPEQPPPAPEQPPPLALPLPESLPEQPAETHAIPAQSDAPPAAEQPADWPIDHRGEN